MKTDYRYIIGCFF